MPKFFPQLLQQVSFRLLKQTDLQWPQVGLGGLSGALTKALGCESTQGLSDGDWADGAVFLSSGHEGGAREVWGEFVWGVPACQ